MELPKNNSQSIFPFRPCKLYHFDYDTSKKWLLVFYQWNIKTQLLERRYFSKFNKLKDAKARLIEAQKWERFINQQLENGAVYNPDLKPGIKKPLSIVKADAPLLLADLQAYLSNKQATLGSDESYKVYRNFGYKITAFVEANQLQQIATKDFTPEWCEK